MDGSNTQSVIRENNNEICNLKKFDIADGEFTNQFKITIENNILHILKNNELLIYLSLKFIYNIVLK